MNFLSQLTVSYRSLPPKIGFVKTSRALFIAVEQGELMVEKGKNVQLFHGSFNEHTKK
jgi:hypothetical protein